MTGQVDRATYSLALTLMCLAIPVVIVAFGFKGCEFRHGTEKTACDEGKLDKCLEAAKAYDPDDPNELIPFLFDYAAVAKREYGKACELGSAQACWRFAEITRQGGGAFVSTSSEADEVHGLEKACEGQISEACAKLGEKYVEGIGVKEDEVKAVALLGPPCQKDLEPTACYWMGIFTWQGRGGLPADPAAGKALLRQSCFLHNRDACIAELKPELYRAVDEQACDAGDDAACSKLEKSR